MARLLQQYREEIAPELMTVLGLKNALQVPRLTKVVVSMGTTSPMQDKNRLGAVAKDLGIITGQKAQLRRARRSVSNFKIRRGYEIGCRVTLRGRRMYEFVDRLINAAVPRMRDFRGLNPKSFDEETFERAQSLCEVVRDPDELASSLWGLATFRVTTGSLTTADELAKQLADLADHGGRPICRVGGAALRATAAYYLGRFQAVLEFCEEAIAANASCEPDSGFTTFGIDSEVYVRGYLGWTLWALGYPDRAAAEVSNAVSRARTLGHPFDLATALVFATLVFKERGDTKDAEALASEAVAVSEANAFPLWLGVGRLLLGWSHAGQPDALEEVQSGVALAGSTGNQAAITHILSIVAEVHRSAGRSEDALGIIEGSLGLSQEQTFWNAELYRQQGELGLELPNHTKNAADALFRKAIAIARSQEAKSLELRAATSLSRLLSTAGKEGEARDILVPIYDWFTEGFDTRDVKDAKLLLDELA